MLFWEAEAQSKMTKPFLGITGALLSPLPTLVSTAVTT